MTLRDMLVSMALHAIVICIAIAAAMSREHESEKHPLIVTQLFFEVESQEPEVESREPEVESQESEAESRESEIESQELKEPIAKPIAYGHMDTGFAIASKPETQNSLPSSPISPEERAKVVSDPTALNRITPKYPRSARRKGHEGRVTVEISVTPEGRTATAGIVASCGHPELDDAAIDAVLNARFAPATEDGAPVHGRLRLTFEFKLQ